MYAAFVVRYRWLLVLGLVLGLGTGVALHFAQPVRYTSTAHMVIVATTVSSAEDSASDVSIDSALQLLRSDQVLGHVAQEMNYPGGATALTRDLTTRPIINSRIVRLSVTALDPDVAQQATTLTAERFFDVREEGLYRAAGRRAGAASDELDVVEAELDRRYGQESTGEITAEDLEELLDDAPLLGPAAVTDLVALRAQLHGELAAFSISEPNAGYLSRPATRSGQGARSGLAIRGTSATVLGLLGAVGAAALHGRLATDPRRPRPLPQITRS